jgi:vitamin B12 transporter
MSILRLFLSVTLIMVSLSLFSQTDTLNEGAFRDTTLLSPVIITLSTEVVWNIVTPRHFTTQVSRSLIESSAQPDLPALLKTHSDADVRQRGIHDVQADISLRGGSFEQTLVLVNGIPFNDPQTGHHTLNLPFVIDDIETIEVSGPVEMGHLWSGFAMGGVVNITTRENSFYNKDIRARVTAGSFGLRRGYAAMRFRTGRWQHYLSLDEAFSDGYTHNTDFHRRQLWMNSRVVFGRTHRVTLNMDGGWMNKMFGANSFYSPRFPDQAEEISASGMTMRLTGGTAWEWRLWGSARLHHDRFELFRHEAPSWYQGHNHHRTVVSSSGAELLRRTSFGSLRAGFIFRDEHIMSNVLGKPIDSLSVPNHKAWYSRADRRQWSELALMYRSKYLGPAIAEGAVNIAMLPGGTLFPAPRLLVTVKPESLKGWLFSTGVSRNYRLPTYTEMYYQGPTNTGNPLLAHEEALSGELNVRFIHRGLQVRSTLFLRDNRNLIDWVKEPGEEIWRSENLSRIFTRGVHIRVFLWPRRKLADLTHLSLSWMYTDQVKRNPDDLISYYVLDHLKQKISLSAQHKAGEKLLLTLDMVWQQRAGSYTTADGAEREYPDAFLIDAGVRFQMTEVLSWQIHGRNLLNTDHFDFSGVVHPGRWFSAGVLLDSPW